jgi:hypothetical protein
MGDEVTYSLLREPSHPSFRVGSNDADAAKKTGRPPEKSRFFFKKVFLGAFMPILPDLPREYQCGKNEAGLIRY